MTIDDAIGHCDVTADVAEAYAHKQMAEKYREIGKWLRELKALKDGDMVSRRAAIAELNAKYHGMISDESMKIYQIINWLANLPSAKPKIGLWIDTDNYYRRWKCSKCGCHTREDTPYCPFCGRKMYDKMEVEHDEVGG